MCHFSLMGAKVVKSWQLAVISCQFLGDVLGEGYAIKKARLSRVGL